MHEFTSKVVLLCIVPFRGERYRLVRVTGRGLAVIRECRTFGRSSDGAEVYSAPKVWPARFWVGQSVEVVAGMVGDRSRTMTVSACDVRYELGSITYEVKLEESGRA